MPRKKVTFVSSPIIRWQTFAYSADAMPGKNHDLQKLDVARNNMHSTCRISRNCLALTCLGNANGILRTCSEAYITMQELSGELRQRSVEVQHCIVRAENAERSCQRLKDDLEHSQQLQLSTQQECARQAKGVCHLYQALQQQSWTQASAISHQRADNVSSILSTPRPDWMYRASHSKWW